VDLSETRRVLYQINLRNCASRWFLLEEYITMTGPLNVKCVKYVKYNFTVSHYPSVLYLQTMFDIQCLRVLIKYLGLNFTCLIISIKPKFKTFTNRTITLRLKRSTILMQKLYFIIIKYLYIFRASICPSSGVLDVCYCIWCSVL
jgi:hypothetical protein